MAQHVIITMRKKKSGGMAVALFVVLVAAITVAASYCLSPRDTMIAYIPADAIVYIHGQTRTAAWALPTDERLRPREFATVILPGERGPVTATLLRWTPWLGPSAGETDTLSTLSATELADGIFAYGDEMAISALRSRSSSIIIDRPDLGAAMAAARSAFGLQAFIRGSMINAPPELPLRWEADDILVAALSHNDVGFVGAAGSVASFAAVGPLGYGPPKSDAVTPHRGPLVAPAHAFMTVAGTNEGQELSPAVFRQIIRARVAAGVPENERLMSAASVLRDIFRGGTLTALRGDEPAMRIGMTIKVERYDDLIEALTDYLNASLPERRSLTLPDGTTTSEFVLGEGEALAPAGNDILRLHPDIRAIHDADLFIRKAGEFVHIAADTTTLAALELAMPVAHGTCPGMPMGLPTLILHDADAFSLGPTAFDVLVDRTGTATVVLQDAGDGRITFCGY